ncbi:MAG: tRNA lysidine(34) synthetase TilS [Bacteroidetes bacterium]|nr:MAG: tRNA lysidine(34) synthetase TilS [Bacteroidota bacterium]
MNLLQRFQNYISSHHLFSQNDQLFLAVSGGLDSVVLCSLCAESSFNIVILHANFQLRGEESERDEKFVRELGGRFHLRVVVSKFETEKFASDQKISIQEAARNLRYTWFRQVLQEYPVQPGLGRRWILTAHHLDDNIETLLLHFFRGTGISGLRSIPMKQGKIVRPLLFAEKKELHDYATEKKLNWVEDSSNATDKYTRNYIRHQLIPLVSKIFPDPVLNLASNIDRFREIEILYKDAIANRMKKLIEYRGKEIYIPVLKLKKEAALTSVVFELLNEFGFTSAQTKEAINLIDAETGKYILSEKWRLLKNRQWLILSPRNEPSSQIIVIDQFEKKIQFENGLLVFDVLKPEEVQLSAGHSTALLDAGLVRYPLILRKWKPGDYFYPLGMRKKKKLSRFFIDQKLSLIDKEKAWVLEMDKKIIWVVNQRIDDRFKLTPHSENVLKIEMRMG